MATYVISDVHGHARAFDELLNRVSPSSSDTVYILGDLVDRGPNPLDAVRIARSLPNGKVLLGNHEDLMLSCIDALDDQRLWDDWVANGGATTAADLTSLAPEAFSHLIDWFSKLPRWDTCVAGGRLYGLVHAGIRPYPVPYRPPSGVWDEAALAAVFLDQDPEDLVWVRHEFWERPTGLVGPDGDGPVIVAGHTPTTFTAFIGNGCEGKLLDESGRAQMLFVGATDATGDVADKICVDCAAAMGAGRGQVGCLRLDDLERYYAPVREGQ